MLLRNNLVLSLLLVAISAISAHAQISANATATATIISPLSIEKETDMNFGNIVVGATAGTVVLEPVPVLGTPVRVQSGGVSLPLTTPGTVSAASFRVSGATLHTYAVTLPENVTLTNVATDAFMVADKFKTSLEGNIGVITDASLNVFHVGATLTVEANQAAGVYVSPPFQVTINYN